MSNLLGIGRIVAALSVLLLIAGCTRSADDPGVALTTLAPASSALDTSPEPALGAKPERDWVDSDAILTASGFQRCPDGPFHVDPPIPVSDEVLSAIIESGIGSGWGAPSAPDGVGARIHLFVLDEASLATLADITTPEGICVDGEDPNDFVPLGDQPPHGPGWHWIGAGLVDDEFSRQRLAIELITNQADYDQLWGTLSDGPDTGQPTVDFGRQTIVAIAHHQGVNDGACGARIDAVWTQNDDVVIDIFSPGGFTRCEHMSQPAISVIAVDHELSGPPPFTVLTRRGPDLRPTLPSPVPLD